MDQNDTQGTLTHDIQGNILRGYTFGHARFAFVEIHSAAEGRSWLGGLPVSTGGFWDDVVPECALGVALTHRGLAQLGVHADLLGEFPEDFRTGMQGRHAEIGDPDDPSAWDALFRDEAHRIHALLAWHGDDPELLDAKVQESTDHAGIGLLEPVQTAKILEGREHFGFRDGISQPIQKLGDDGWISAEGVPLGEFLVFDSRWNDGAAGTSEKGRKLGRLGTYMVYRKLQQNVVGFRDFLQGRPIPPDTAAAKMVGRWTNGTPLTKHPTAPSTSPGDQSDNDFDYVDSNDDTGHKCPFGAHISRANPRSRLSAGTNDHRILRRGIPYGEPIQGWLDPLDQPISQDDGAERGLLFIALNASIGDQFEFLQRSWINEPTFLLQDGSDPVAATGPSELGKFRPSPDLAPWPLSSFVTLRGGEYFFVPSTQALAGLAAGEFDTP